MRVTKLTLKNYRTFGNEQTIDFDQNKNITVILGNNGCGKSSILDALAVLLSSFTGAFPGKPTKNFLKTDVHINEECRYSDFLTASADVHFDKKIFPDEKDVNISRSLRGSGSGKLPEQNLKSIKECAENLAQWISINKEPVLPIFAYYGTGRGFFTMPQRKRNFKKVIERWDCYDGCLLPSANFKKFVETFDLLEDEERRKIRELRDFDYKLPKLKFIRQAIEDFVCNKFTNPRIEVRPLRFVMDEKETVLRGPDSIPTQIKKQIRLEQMSDGYKIMTTMVADIATRMVEANPESVDPLKTPGIVLIDEVDLHLHPKWQREVLNQLSKTFENVQFIVTTHSPVVLLGADSSKVQVALVDDGKIKRDVVPDLRDLSVNQLLQDDVFALESVRNPYWQEKIDKQDILLAKSELTEDEQRQLELLNDEVRQISFSESAKSKKINLLIEKLAKSMGIDIEKID